ncbi:DUF3073 domain-containing protein [Arthrobacter sp. MYb211]|uniref:DUF3073 domain-containing protein n=1 Tax=Micrococcaceae TaxID=1268 RepID=UPI000BB93339|nr:MULTISPECIES: DUF3073 domain-containing protein [Micrococcaceae]PCC30086.1 hypothetical protein CIK76_03045 [Glutamicibacter sp. BW80]PQZ99599.1 DUF3073 domain-containing protein [Arthrobacter sp. MYb224]PRA05935.1 DUF3073 domain-containing protein [Arthrobacter sp. MYb229]PRA11293.1 DUF3073 domain-containing protein [Arthrobacter sp. MYb221]PRB52837.1 DUF3073 domain-containing protein [Arthrobacter sp. MYb216]
MGRGRQKAKAQRQARDIKYYSPSTDLTALERELGVRSDYHAQNLEPDNSSHDDEESDYDELTKKYSGDDDAD